MCDTALPIGAYAFSNGLETYTQQGLIPEVAALQEWLEATLHHAVHGSHLLPVALAYRATAAGDWAQVSTGERATMSLADSFRVHARVFTHGFSTHGKSRARLASTASARERRTAGLDS
jgi:urease accessory protein UreF